jgi:hypothetical protein
MGMVVMGLPAQRAGSALEGPLEIAGNPAAVEVAVLSNDDFVSDLTVIDPAGVEGNFARESLETLGWFFVGPRSAADPLTRNDEVKITRHPFEFAEGVAAHGNQKSLGEAYGLSTAKIESVFLISLLAITCIAVCRNLLKI